MFSFAVFDESGVPRSAFELRGEHLIGNDDMPAAGEIKFVDGLIRVTKDTTDAAGMSLVVDVPAPPAAPPPPGVPPLPNPGAILGKLALRTCFLPKRDEPYLLSIELARHRIMLVLNKLEEWGMFDLAPEHPLLVQLDSARRKFSEAIVADRSGGSITKGQPSQRAWADKLAWEALGLALDCSEKIALIAAQRDVPQRLIGRTYEDAKARYTKLIGDPPSAGAAVVVPGAGHAVVPGGPQVGVAVNPAQFAEPLQKYVAGLDFVTMPLRWSDLEPVEGKLSFAATDRWIEWAIRTAKLPVIAGPIIDLRPQCLPEWAYIWENDYETLRDMMIEHITQVVTRYRRTVTRWTVCSGLHVNSNVKLSYEQIMDLTKVCVLLTKKIHPQAKIAVEVQEPWGEYFSYDRKSLPPTFYAESVLNSGLAVDAVALRLQIGAAASGQTARDLMALSNLLDRYAAMERPVHVTALGAPSGVAPVAAPAKKDEDDDGPLTLKTREHVAGFWRVPWSEALQATWLTDAIGVIASKPCVQSICWQDLADAPLSPRLPEMPLGGLFSPAGAAKPAAAQLAAWRNAMKENKSLL